MPKHRDFNARFRERCEREHVSFFVPPEYAVQLADDRTEGMIGVYTFMQLYPHGFEQSYRHLRELVRSAYLQGVSDASEAIFSKENR